MPTPSPSISRIGAPAASAESLATRLAVSIPLYISGSSDQLIGGPEPDREVVRDEAADRIADPILIEQLVVAREPGDGLGPRVHSPPGRHAGASLTQLVEALTTRRQAGSGS